MLGIWRRDFAPAVFALFVPAVVTLVLCTPARAGELDAAMAKAPDAPRDTLFGSGPIELKPDVGEVGEDNAEVAAAELEKIWAEDFHPETDRWTERNNRIKISFLTSVLAFAENLRILPDLGFGLRVSWEVPGFIGIRLDSVAVPWSHMRVADFGQSQTTNDTHHDMQGFVDVTSLSIAIFNPELSAAPNLAMWAGFGADMWNYHYAELFGGAPAGHIEYAYIDYNFGGNLFFNLEYKLADIFHIGFEIKEHIVYAPQTERGEFYKVNSETGFGLHTFGTPHSRNALPVALSEVLELQLHVSVLF
jgi:hypothetical protein